MKIIFFFIYLTLSRKWPTTRKSEHRRSKRRTPLSTKAEAPEENCQQIQISKQTSRTHQPLLCGIYSLLY